MDKQGGNALSGQAGCCRVCGARLHDEPLTVPEMSMGTGEQFRFAECTGCGSIQLLDVPDDLGRYYPPGYYSFVDHRPGKIAMFLKSHRASGALGRPTLLSGLVRWVVGDPPFTEWARPPYVTPGARILDVGTGGGRLLREMALGGFTDLMGVDPYLAAETDPFPGVKMLKGRLQDVPGQFDTVMLHHVLEHFEDPVGAMREVGRLTRPGGFAIVRVPLSGSYAWRTYGASWVQLDPPRHICIPSARGVEILASAGGFEVAEVRFDSTAFQFWGSEQVRMAIPLHDRRSVHVRGGRGSFTRRQMRSFGVRAIELNRTGEGDQACFYLRRLAHSTHTTESPA
jgi:SAM-dependent methyltransferase